MSPKDHLPGAEIQYLEVVVGPVVGGLGKGLGCGCSLGGVFGMLVFLACWVWLFWI